MFYFQYILFISYTNSHITLEPSGGFTVVKNTVRLQQLKGMQRSGLILYLTREIGIE